MKRSELIGKTSEDSPLTSFWNALASAALKSDATVSGGLAWTRDLGASVRERLLNQARAPERPFQELSRYYAMERSLSRLPRSRPAEQFILKGALLLTTWRAPLSRATMDIDPLGRTSNELEYIRVLFASMPMNSNEKGCHL